MQFARPSHNLTSLSSVGDGADFSENELLFLQLDELLLIPHPFPDYIENVGSSLQPANVNVSLCHWNGAIDNLSEDNSSGNITNY